MKNLQFNAKEESTNENCTRNELEMSTRIRNDLVRSVLKSETGNPFFCENVEKVIYNNLLVDL